MNPRRPFDEVLETWLDEGPSTAPQDLLESAYTDIPATHHQGRRFSVARRFPMFASSMRLLGTAAAVVLVAVVGFAVLRGFAPTGAGGSPTPSPTDTAVVTPTDVAGASPTPESTVPFCAPEDLALQVTSWDGAAGHRIADVTMTNTGSAACQTLALDRPQLVGPRGESVLINGVPPASSAMLTIEAGGTLSTLVQVGNYCGPEVTEGPVSVAFILSSGTGRVVAEPLTPTDLSGIPPCNSSPGAAGTIEMHPWAP